MAWAEVCITVSRQDTEAAESALEELGSLAITLEDDEDNPVLEPGPGETPLWPSVYIRGLFESGINRDFVMNGLSGLPGAARPGNIRWRDVGDQDWERVWMDRFKPMQFGQRLWIVPGGMSIPYEAENIEIKLDPGLAFGTGTHPTTALCLEWLDDRDLAGDCVVDYGCGSGILGIAAAMKAAGRVICVDNDPQALEATGENAVRNKVTDQVEGFLPADCPQVTADIVMANILALPLVELAPLLLDLLGKGGDLVLSGILQEQTEQVLRAYQHGIQKIEVKQQEGWVLIYGEKR